MDVLLDSLLTLFPPVQELKSLDRALKWCIIGPALARCPKRPGFGRVGSLTWQSGLAKPAVRELERRPAPRRRSPSQRTFEAHFWFNFAHSTMQKSPDKSR